MEVRARQEPRPTGRIDVMEPVTPVQRLVVDSLTVEVYADQSELGFAAARAAWDYLGDVLARQERAAVILASASSQVKLLEALTGASGKGRVDWSRVIFFHMDEYLGIAAEHPASFRRFMREYVEGPLTLAL